MRRGVQFGLVGAVLALEASASAQGAPEWQLRDFHSTASVAGESSPSSSSRATIGHQDDESEIEHSGFSGKVAAQRALSQRRWFASERCDPARTVHSYSQWPKHRATMAAARHTCLQED